MKVYVIFIIYILFFTILSSAKDFFDISVFPLQKQAQVLLGTEDEYIHHLSQFDIDSRLREKNSTKTKLIQFQVSQVLEWDINEIKLIKTILKRIDKNINKSTFSLPLLNKIRFIKTTGEEEGGADAYTRSDYIVLTQKLLDGRESRLEEVIAHEIFHILTRTDNNFRQKMYQIIGFKHMDYIKYPEELIRWKISNPDTPQTDSYYITLDKNGTKIDCMMLMLASNEYMGGSFFKYISILFLALDKSKNLKPILHGGHVVLYSYEDILENTNFIEQVGKNTQYLIHAEEILADNFAYILTEKDDLPDQWLIKNMKKLLLK